MDTCLICLDELNDNIIKPNNCECNVSLHSECLNSLIKYGLLCPICRIKNPQLVNGLGNVIAFGADLEIAIGMNAILNNYFRNHFFTLLSLILFLILMTFFYLLPKLIYILFTDPSSRYYAVKSFGITVCIMGFYILVR